MDEKILEWKTPLLDFYEHVALTKSFLLPYKSREEVGEELWPEILDDLKTYGPSFGAFDALAHLFFTPGEPNRCIGSGDVDFRMMECRCNECDHNLTCFPEIDQEA